MGSFVVRGMVADMTFSSQLRFGGERVRPLKVTMSLYKKRKEKKKMKHFTHSSNAMYASLGVYSNADENTLTQIKVKQLKTAVYL